MHGLEFQPHRRTRALQTLRGDSAVLEIGGAQTHAAHRQAFEQQRIETLANDGFGGSPADVDHQSLVRTHRTGVRNARINQARLFQPGDDFDGVAECCAGVLQEPAFALGVPQGIGADDPYAVRPHGPQPLSESLQAAQCPIGCGIIQPPAGAQACSQAHHFAQSIENDELAVRVTRDNHVKAVGAQIDGGEHVGHEPTAAHLHDQHSRPRMKTRSRRLFSRWGYE